MTPQTVSMTAPASVVPGTTVTFENGTAGTVAANQTIQVPVGNDVTMLLSLGYKLT